MVLDDIDRTSKEVLHKIEHKGADLLTGSPFQQLLLAITAGAFISFAASLAAVLASGFTATGAQKFMQGLAFTCGFGMVVLSGSALFTEINVVVPRFLMKHWRETLTPTLKFWVTVYIGNLIGVIFVATLINISDTLWIKEVNEELRSMMDFKMHPYILAVTENGGTSASLCKAWWQVFVSGILGNWLVGMVVFFAGQARTVYGKVIGTFLPVLTFTALGVQHSMANMGILITGMIYQGIYQFEPPLHYGWWQIFAMNIIPASVGNLVGSIILVVLLFSYAFRRKTDVDEESCWFREPFEMNCTICEAEKRAQELQFKMQAGKSFKKSEPIRMRDNQRTVNAGKKQHPFANITLSEDWGAPIIRHQEKSFNRLTSWDEAEFEESIEGFAQARTGSQLAKFARHVADNVQIEEQFDNDFVEI